MKESLSVRFLYKTQIGRMILKLLVHPWISKVAGSFLSSKASKFIISGFIRKHGISLENIEIPKGGFQSFNAFFSRKRRITAKDLASEDLISPCDAFLSLVPIEKDSSFEIKHTRYSLTNLLDDEKLAKMYEGGMAFIFRLTPTHYHRYHYPLNGKIRDSRKISGKLHCVRPVALENVPVYIQNSREYQIISSDRFGVVTQMEIGALLVGKIVNSEKKVKGTRVFCGEEKGYFEFGGSTILMLFQRDQISVDSKIAQQLVSAVGVLRDKEIPVVLGQVLARPQ